MISSHAFRIHLIWNDFWENFAEISLYFIQQFRKLDVSCFKILMILNWILGVHYVKRTVSIGLLRFVVGSAKENKHRHPYEFYEDIYKENDLSPVYNSNLLYKIPDHAIVDFDEWNFKTNTCIISTMQCNLLWRHIRQCSIVHASTNCTYFTLCIYTKQFLTSNDFSANKSMEKSK